MSSSLLEQRFILVQKAWIILDPVWKSDAHQDKGSNTSALMFDYGVMLLIMQIVIVFLFILVLIFSCCYCYHYYCCYFIMLLEVID
jgi:hypothetical protein